VFDSFTIMVGVWFVGNDNISEKPDNEDNTTHTHTHTPRQ